VRGALRAQQLLLVRIIFRLQRAVQLDGLALALLIRQPPSASYTRQIIVA
jgi:hypothetical protein